MDELTPNGARDANQPDDVGPVLGDADLVAQVRDGQDEPYAELYRRHQPAALALARTLTEHTSADDVVSEAFEKLLQRIRGGGGPEAAFRPYLLRTVRTVAVDASRRTRRLVVAEDPEDAAGATHTEDDGLVDAVHERTTLARAFAALPERWQAFLWLSFVDDADRREIATILGTSVGSVSALGYRAREGLRRAYLDAHLREAPTPECAEVWPLLAGAVRGGLSPTQQAEVDEHLAECDHCRAAVAELEAVNTRFGAVLAPIVLGAAAPAYLAAVQPGGALASAGTAAAAAGVVAEGGAAAGTAHLSSGASSGLKAIVAGWSKTGTGVAVVACSTVALVAVLALFTAPLSSEPLVAPRPGTSVPDGSAASRGPGSDGTGEGEGPGGTTEGIPGSTPADPNATTASGDPTTSGGPTTGLPTATTGGPTGPPTATTTGGPTGGPTSGPTSAPTSAGTKPPTPTPSGTRSPTPDGTPTTTTPTVTTSEPTPTPTPSDGPTVDAGLAALVVDSRNQTNFPAHVAIPVSLAGGKADLQITVTVVGLNKFSTTSGAGEGAWACVALTPMAGAGKTAVIRCALNNAAPSDPLTLGLNLGYAGDGSLSAVLAVLGNVADDDLSDNTAAADLPPRQG